MRSTLRARLLRWVDSYAHRTFNPAVQFRQQTDRH